MIACKHNNRVKTKAIMDHPFSLTAHCPSIDQDCVLYPEIEHTSPKDPVAAMLTTRMVPGTRLQEARLMVSATSAALAVPDAPGAQSAATPVRGPFF